MFFAEISAYDPPVLIACVLGCLMFLVMGANAASDFWRNIKDKPTGAEVLEKARAEFQPKGDYITRHEYSQFKKNLEEKLGTLSAENQNILMAGQKREEHLASLIEALDSRIDELPGRMVEEITATIELVQKLQGKKS